MDGTHLMVKIHNNRHKHIFCWFYTSQKDKKEDWGGKGELDGEIGTVKKTARQAMFVYVFVCRGGEGGSDFENDT